MTTYMTQPELQAHAKSRSTKVQLETLEKMLKIGWTVTKVTSDSNKAMIGMCMKGTAAWLLDTGKIERAAVGKKSVSVHFHSGKRA